MSSHVIQIFPLPKAPAAIFSWKLFINGTEITHFGDMRMSCSCDGMGTEGVVSAAFTFAVPLSEHPRYSETIPGNAEIVLQKIHDGSVGDTRIFYVSTKSSDDTKVTVRCYDRMTYTDTDFPCTNEDFVDSEGKEKKLPVGIVLNRISEACGIGAILFDTVTVNALDFEMTDSMLWGRSCRDVLSTISKLICGYFVFDGMNTYFIALGREAENGSPIDCGKHEKLRYTTYLQINNVYMTDTSGKSYGGFSGGSDTIAIESQLASSALYQTVSGRIGTYYYRGWDCDTAIFSGIPNFPILVHFEDEEDPRYANYYDVKLSSDGIIGSVGCNIVDESAFVYKERKQRELEKKYSEGDTWNNTEITKKGGIKFVYKNENK